MIKIGCANMFLQFPNKSVALKGVDLTPHNRAFAVYGSGYTVEITEEWISGEMHHISEDAFNFWKAVAVQMGWDFNNS